MENDFNNLPLNEMLDIVLEKTRYEALRLQLIDIHNNLLTIEAIHNILSEAQENKMNK